ncbi:hypothetical protein ACFOY5_22280 [Massilia aurea]|jgi:uncharacterized membrane protein|uniref:hypothetical protein n=1 Tax=Massilia aurea TaxID=373040 RepID=UPI002162BBBB|nr:hypothetical protein [Massilia aurea]MCS0709707.1 hypothetical protein [Massilia aurea]
MALLSLALTLLSALTFWLAIPIFILPPLGAYAGYRAYRAHLERQPRVSRSRKLLWMLPMLLAIVAMPLELYVLNAGYRV